MPNGKGRLVLKRSKTDPNDFSSVHIEATFKEGEEPHRIEQLSGGEKSLVAIALIFAIQRFVVAHLHTCTISSIECERERETELTRIVNCWVGRVEPIPLRSTCSTRLMLPWTPSTELPSQVRRLSRQRASDVGGA